MIDTHCHIDDPQYAEDLAAFLADQQASGVEAILVPGVDKTSVKDVLEVCNKYPKYLFPALGLHPENVKEDWQEQLQVLKAAVDARMSNSPKGVQYPIAERPISERKLIAIGEIGLDYHWDVTFKEQQHEALREQMRWAEQYHLPVMIHSRDATEDTLNILREFPTVKGVMHCFSGSYEVAKQVVDMGYYLGIGGVLTFKNCKLAEHLVGIPLERLVLETDAPYMAPVPHRGKRNESKWMWYVVERLAEVYNCSPEHVNEVTTANAKALFVINL
ncbi:MAG: TatD family deoxyribonuclease [Bacteroidales bacterium]|nr:TatD family deoxyribonuclease [Bacteroidales bacterium]